MTRGMSSPSRSESRCRAVVAYRSAVCTYYVAGSFAVNLQNHRQYTVDQKNDTDVAHYNFDTGQPIFIILGRAVAERVCYQMVICYPTSPN